MPESHRISESLDEIIARRAEFLTRYQDAAYAARYRERIARVRATENARMPGSAALTEAAAQALFKVMAYKDEYEVARLYTESDFLKRVAAQFEGDYTLKFHLAPPLTAGRDAAGHLQKRAYGPWMLAAFRVLAKLRRLRGTAFDIFGRTAERKMERQLIAEYDAVLDEIAARLAPQNHAVALELAALPLEIRGFGHIKEANRERAKAKEADLLTRFRSAPHAMAAE
jgi:indolepyruvate ferredoxin oxidoreductase